VWGFVTGLLKDPDRLRAGLERMVEWDRASSRGNPEKEIRAWVERLGQIDRERSDFQDMAAEGLITIDELRTKLAALEESRKTATAEVERIRERAERARALESDTEALLRTYSAMVPAGLKALDPDERRRVYGMTRLRIEIAPDGAMHARGVLGEPLGAAREDRALLRKKELTPECYPEHTKTSGFAFRAVVGGGIPHIRLERSKSRRRASQLNASVTTTTAPARRGL
jgi:hypothetical protein